MQKVDGTGVPRDLPGVSSKIARRSDATCFESYSDIGPGYIPECSRCGRPSVGGSFISMDTGTPVGRTLGTVEFSCGCSGRTFFAISSRLLFPAWKLINEQRPGVWTIVHMTPKQKAEICSQR